MDNPSVKTLFISILLQSRSDLGKVYIIQLSGMDPMFYRNIFPPKNKIRFLKVKTYLLLTVAITLELFLPFLLFFDKNSSIAAGMDAAVSVGAESVSFRPASIMA